VHNVLFSLSTAIRYLAIHWQGKNPKQKKYESFLLIIAWFAAMRRQYFGISSALDSASFSTSSAILLYLFEINK